eukprot:6476727-Prymnesium_polylepis.4
MSTVPAGFFVAAVWDTCHSSLSSRKRFGVVSVRQPSSVAEIICPSPSGASNTIPKSLCGSELKATTMQSPADSGGSGGDDGGFGG